MRGKTLPIVFAIAVMDMVGVGILIPIIPLLLADPSYPYHLDIPLSSGLIVLGFLTAIYPFMQFLSTPVLGQISDQIGRKPVLAFSLLGTSLSYVIFAVGIITRNIPLLFLSRALDGITGGNTAVAQAAIADSTPPHLRAHAFGIMGAAFGIGFIIGPFLGGRLSDPRVLSWFNATTPFWFAAIVSFLNMLAVMFFFRETLKEKIVSRIHFGRALANIRRAVLDRRLRPLYGSAFLFQSGFAFFTTFFGVYLISRFNLSQAGIGDFFALIGLCVVFTQAVITGYVARRWSAYRIISVAMLGVALTIVGMYFADARWQLYLIALPNAMCIALVMANMTGLISRSAEDHRQGEVLGISASVQAFAQAVPPVLAGFLAALFTPESPVIIAACIIFLCALTFIYTCRPKVPTHDIPVPGARG